MTKQETKTLMYARIKKDIRVLGYVFRSLAANNNESLQC